ncbi:hypothetical protein [Nannocystis exedens]|uniref:hypothetical protein n=1 Tax=Nannocystis exedens TaxID=54 RepID=UPI000C2AA915|nr:hypothetical protein [Nannocystis exedens]
MAMLGRGPGPDYSALLADNQATPLELYMAVRGDERPVPADLELAHAWEVERSRPGDTAPRRLAVPTLDPQFAYGPSDYTCLSWSNFQQYMSTRFPNDSGRDLTLASSTAVSGGNVWTDPYQYDSKADLVACNYMTISNDPGYTDLIIANVCYWDGPGPAGIEVGCLEGDLHNGWYVREIYSRSPGTRYYITVDPVGATPLQSFMGILKANL